MSLLFMHYPKCSTSRKAKTWLDDNNIIYELRDIVSQNPTSDELKCWFERSGLSIKKFFNTSGLVYKELELKDKLETMTNDEKFDILSTNGKLVKRPIIVSDDYVLVGFKEKEWEKIKN